jgi:phage replication-related protein YjqB (UPF0714/DUF867 family)
MTPPHTLGEAPSGTAPDRYADYAALAGGEIEGVDFVIIQRTGRSDVAVIAPHGGGIEPGTADIADAVAADRHTFYGFKGIKPAGNRVLHITSNHFDEPRCVRIAEAAAWVLTLHGCRGAEEIVWVGGRHMAFRTIFIRTLRRFGFQASSSRQPGLRGLQPGNLCNRGRQGRGVQLEITAGLRRRLYLSIEYRRVRQRTPAFYRLVAALSVAIRACNRQACSDATASPPPNP